MGIKEVLKVKRSDAEALLDVLGIEDVQEMSNKKILKTLTNPDNLPEGNLDNKEMDALLDKVLEAEEIEIISEEDTESEESEESEEKEEKKTKKEKKEKKEKAPKKMNRVEASTKVLLKLTKKGMTRDEAINACDEFYVKNGGDPNLKEATPTYNRTVQVLQIVGLVTIDEDGRVKPVSQDKE
jgi:hypothetical protein